MSYVPCRKPTISNVTLTSANTEYSHTLAANCRNFSIKARGNTNAVRVAFTSGVVASPSGAYLTVEAGQTWLSPPNLVGDGTTLYFASANAGAVVEILEWTNQPA